MQEEYTNVITLTDSDGSDVDFEVLDIVPYKEHEYVIMLPVDDESDSPEAVILELLEAEEDNEEDMLQGVDDEGNTQRRFQPLYGKERRRVPV